MHAGDEVRSSLVRILCGFCMRWFVRSNLLLELWLLDGSMAPLDPQLTVPGIYFMAARNVQPSVRFLTRCTRGRSKNED